MGDIVWQVSRKGVCEGRATLLVSGLFLPLGVIDRISRMSE